LCWYKQISAPLLPVYFIYSFKKTIMGRGDKKTKKGKIFKGSFGKSRPSKPAKTKKAAEKEA
jgi:30S ribosomal protein S31